MLVVKRWLQLVAVVHIMGGLLLPIIVHIDIVQPYFRFMADTFALNHNQDLLFLQFMVGVFGPTIASWGVLFFGIVTYAFSQPNKGIWWLMIFACVVWAVYDSVYSSLFGLWINAVINAVAFLSIVIPLCMVRREFME